MWVLPFLNPRHAYPLTTFYQEWWSAVLGVLAMGILAGKEYWRVHQIPRIALLPALLIVVALIQWIMGMVPYLEQVLLYILYFLFAMMLMLLGARLKDLFGLNKVATTLAAFLLVGAELSALVGIVQQYHWHTPLDSMIAMKVATGIYGNIAQPNHFANYVSLGLISLGLLRGQQCLNGTTTVLLALPLLFVLALSGSRSAWLYVLVMLAVAWWLGRGREGYAELLRYCQLVVAGFVLVNLLLQVSLVPAAVETTNALQRLMGNNETGIVRLYLWRESIQMFLNSPWLGNGFGQFAWQHFRMLPEFRQPGIEGLYNNAHNIVFQLGAETGTAGLLLLGITMSSWLIGVRKDTLESVAQDGMVNDQKIPAYWWGLSSLGVLAIHSLLEYPMWYAYFLSIAAILLGLLDGTRYSLAMSHFGRVSAIAVLLIAIAILVQFRVGYRQLEQLLATRSLSGSEPHMQEAVRRDMEAIRHSTLLAPYAELFMGSSRDTTGDQLHEKLETNSRVLRFMPVGSVSYRQATLLAQAGDIEAAKVEITRAIWSYPGDFQKWRLRMANLADNDPATFSPLIEFASRVEQEYQIAVH
jgi:O-antigen ligase